MRTQIILTCPKCGIEYSKDKSEYDRNNKLGRVSVCSLACTGDINRIPINKISHYNISQHSKNRIDKYTPFRYYVKLMNNHKKDVSVTIDDLIYIWEKQNGVCPYTLVKLKLQTHSSIALHNLNDWYLYASIDRIDSRKPYSLDNIEFVSVGINYLKNRFRKQEVIDFLKIISDNLNDKSFN